MKFIVIAPDGNRCMWTASSRPSWAIKRLLAGRVAIWPYALAQGYRLAQVIA